MKYMKMLGLLAVAAAALMAFVGSASAATLTSPTGTALGTGAVIKATSGVTKLDGSVKVECTSSHVEGTITNAGGKHGGTTTTVSGPLTKLEFTECHDTVTVLNKGSLEIHSLGNGEGTLTSTGAEITVVLHRFLLGFPITTHCIYKTNNTDVGTLTDSHKTGSTATLDIGSAGIPQVETDGACGNDAVWTGDYTVTAPDPLYID